MKRNSFQRQLVMDTLKALDHPTAQEVFAHIGKIYPRMSLGTVYRNLQQLSEEEKVRRLSFPNSPDRYDIHLEPHQHIFCLQCGGYSNIDEASLGDIDQNVEEVSGFKVEGHHILFHGVCPACRDDDSKNKGGS